MKDITIVLLNYHMKDDVLRAVRSIVKDVENCPYEVHITVVDNSNNADGIMEELRHKHSTVSYLNCQKNVGFGQGNTLGFQASPARYFFALNGDTIIPKNSATIERLIRFMDNNPKIGCVGPKLLNMDGSLQYSCYRFDPRSIFIKPFKQINLDQKYLWVKKYTDKLLMRDFNHNETRPVDWVLGAAMVVRSEVARAIGWFDPRYFMYMEDCDWCRAMWENGWPVYYVHDIVINHAYARGSAAVPGMLRAVIRNKLARLHIISWFKYMWKWRNNIL